MERCITHEDTLSAAHLAQSITPGERVESALPRSVRDLTNQPAQQPSANRSLPLNPEHKENTPTLKHLHNLVPKNGKAENLVRRMR